MDDDHHADHSTPLRAMLRAIARRPTGSGLSHWLHSFSLHVVTGFAAVAVHYALMYGLLRAGAAPVPASAIGFTVLLKLVNYLAYRWWVFR